MGLGGGWIFLVWRRLAGFLAEPGFAMGALVLEQMRGSFSYSVFFGLWLRALFRGLGIKIKIMSVLQNLLIEVDFSFD